MARTTERLTLDLSPAEESARTAADVALDAPLSPAEIENRESEKASLLARITPPPPDDAPAPVAPSKDALLAKLEILSAAGRAPREQFNTARRAELDASVRPYLTAIRSEMTSHGQLRVAWFDRVNAVASLDWPSIFRALPQKLEPTARGLVDVNHRAMTRLHAAANAARASLTSTFGDSAPGPRDIDPVNASAAAAVAGDLLAGDGWLHAGTDTVSQTFLRAATHLRVWAERAAAIAAGAKNAVEKFEAALAHAQEVFGDDVQPRTSLPTSLMVEKIPAPKPRKPEEFNWSGDPRTLGEELDEYNARPKTPPPSPGSVGTGKVIGIVGGGSR